AYSQRANKPRLFYNARVKASSVARRSRWNSLADWREIRFAAAAVFEQSETLAHTALSPSTPRKRPATRTLKTTHMQCVDAASFFLFHCVYKLSARRGEYAAQTASAATFRALRSPEDPSSIQHL